MPLGYNHVHLVGFVGSQPDLKHTSSGLAILSFSLATAESKKDAQGEWTEATEWHRIKLFKYQAENGAKLIQKGSMIGIVGKIHYSTSEYKGEKKHFTEIIGNRFMLLRDPKYKKQDNTRDDDEDDRPPF